MFVHTEKRPGKWGKVEIKLQNIFLWTGKNLKLKSMTNV